MMNSIRAVCFVLNGAFIADLFMVRCHRGGHYCAWIFLLVMILLFLGGQSVLIVFTFPNCHHRTCLRLWSRTVECRTFYFQSCSG